jgi:hypothetical protein
MRMNTIVNPGNSDEASERRARRAASLGTGAEGVVACGGAKHPLPARTASSPGRREELLHPDGGPVWALGTVDLA